MLCRKCCYGTYNSTVKIIFKSQKREFKLGSPSTMCIDVGKTLTEPYGYWKAPMMSL